MTNNDSNNPQQCKYDCGTEIIFKGKVKGKKGSTGFFETANGTTEHTYWRCFSIRIEKGLYATKRNKR